MFCKCGAEIPEKRVEFLQKYNKPMSCVNCAEGNVQKVGGFMTSTGKTDRELIIGEQSVINNLYKASARSGVGVSKGVKMNQSFSDKHFK